MYLFTRSVRVNSAKLVESTAFAVKITEKINQISETPVRLWSPIFSPSAGTLVWTTMAENLATFETTDAKLLADSGYLGLLSEAEAFSSGDPIDDAVAELVLADIDPNETLPYAVVVQSVINPGHLAKGIELGVELAQRAKAITGRRTSFSVLATGAYGGVAWITACASIDQVQSAQQALTTSTDWAKLIDDKGSKAYSAPATMQAVYRQIV